MWLILFEDVFLFYVYEWFDCRYVYVPHRHTTGTCGNQKRTLDPPKVEL